MEKRRNPRRQLALTTVLYRQGLAVIGGKVRNIGSGGMFLETGPVSLPKGTTLEAKVSFQTPDGEERFHLEAEVAHRNAEGMGLRFRTRPPEALERLIRRSPGRKPDPGNS